MLTGLYASGSCDEFLPATRLSNVTLGLTLIRKVNFTRPKPSVSVKDLFSEKRYCYIISLLIYGWSFGFSPTKRN